jgi:hypothetical protein
MIACAIAALGGAGSAFFLIRIDGAKVQANSP